MNRSLLFLVLVALLLPTAFAKAEDNTTGRGGSVLGCLKGSKAPHTIDLKDEIAKPERFKGPGTIRLKHLNRLRYATRLGTDLAYTPGPELGVVGFIPEFPAEAKKASTEVQSDLTLSKANQKSLYDFLGTSKLPRTPEEDVAEELSKIQTALGAEATAVGTIADAAKKAADAQASAANEVQAMVLRSDETLQLPGGEATLYKMIGTILKQVNDALAMSWPSEGEVSAVQSRIAPLIVRLEEMPLRFEGFSKWAQSGNSRDDYRKTLEGARKLLQALAPYQKGSAERKAFDAQRAKLWEWHDILTELTPAGAKAEEVFSQSYDVACGYPFFENKTVTIELKLVDRLETDPKKAESKRTLAIVECLSHVTVSGGVGVSGVEETDIQIVTVPTADGTAVERKIRFQDRGSRQVNPTTLIHTRLTAGESCDWHIAAGTVFDIDHPDSGIKLGYVLGASFSFKDFFYLTGGLQLGRVSKLADGVDITKPVPEDLSEVPLERHWTADWVLVGSFKIR